MLITLEGIEGCGKTAQARSLLHRLRQAGHDTVLTEEPGGDILGFEIRNLLLNIESEICPVAELFLFMAARAQHSLLIQDWLNAGKVVICDRYTDSTIAYQGYGRGLNLATISALNSIAGALTPDLTLWIDIPVETGLSRIKNPDRIESSGEAFYHAVAEGYRAICRCSPGRVARIVGEQSMQAIEAEIWAIVRERLGRKRTPDPSR